ncbi:nitroreductase family protein [Dermacoccaceae bacterium W4C1]
MTDSQTSPAPHLELLPLLAQRYSPAVFDPHHLLSAAELDVLLEAVRWSPSAGNSQPWLVHVCTRGDQAHQGFVPTLSRGNSGWVPAASAVLVMSAKMRAAEGEEKPPLGYGQYDAGQAAAHLTMQAESMGLAVHQFAGFDRDAAAVALGVPDTHDVLTGIAVGRWWPLAERTEVPEGVAERELRERRRRPVEKFAIKGADLQLRD